MEARTEGKRKVLDPTILPQTGSDFRDHQPTQHEYVPPPKKKGKTPMKYFLKAISLVSLIASELPEVLADGKITIREILDIGIKAAQKLGYDVDTEGVDLDNPFGN